jgi:hypothetical protein
VTGEKGWQPNTGNQIGRGWAGFRLLFGGASDQGEFGHVLFGVQPNGDLRWYKYLGQGEQNPEGSQHWHPNSGNVIGRGW